MPPLPWNKMKTYSILSRASKVQNEALARPLDDGATVGDFLDSLPQILAAKDLRAVIAAVVDAHRRGRPVILAMVAQVIKVGLNPLIIDLMARGIVTALALNGAGIIHDFELAFIGQTSEDVATELEDGRSGMVEETATYLNDAIARAAAHGIGIGQGVGQMILAGDFPHKQYSLLAAAARLHLPATVHVAIGTDMIHMHPGASGPAIGETAMIDFRRYTEVIANLEGGVYFNIGSAVLLPEVFLKALTVARNLGRVVQNFTVVNMDFIQHDRPLMNVVKRPTPHHGQGFSLTGHHEIMFPLLAAGILSALKKPA